MKKVLVKMKLAYNKLTHGKLAYELRYWKERYRLEGNKLDNHFYADLMLSISDEKDDGFLQGKVVADFGCGPRGSLIWAKSASIRIGIDVLAQRYIQEFPKEYLKHEMIYVCSTESSIPIPDAFCDVVYSVNSLDHVKNLEVMCKELRRILKPGGELIGSFNLNHKPERAEPQTITEKQLKAILFKDFEIKHWWVSAPGPVGKHYDPLKSRQFIAPQKGEYYLWARGVKVGTSKVATSS